MKVILGLCFIWINWLPFGEGSFVWNWTSKIKGLNDFWNEEGGWGFWKLDKLHGRHMCIIPTISHINYWDQVNSWKNLWKFWNGPLCRNKSGPSPYSMLQYIGRVATPKLVSRNCLRYLQTTLIMGGGGLVSEFMWGIV